MQTKAYGPQRQTTPTERAHYVAESIRAHRLDVEDLRTWQRYGLQANAAQQARVRTALAALIHKEER